MGTEQFCVVIAFDHTEEIQAGAALYSLYEHNRDLEKLDVFLAVSGIEEESKERLEKTAARFGRRLFFEDSAQWTARTEGRYRLEAGERKAFLRYMAADMLPAGYQTILYLDPDILVLDSLSPLLKTGRKAGNPVTAVIDDRTAAEKKLIGFRKEDRYYNSKVLLINRKAWKESRCGERIFRHARDVYAKYRLPDQDIFNIALKGEIGVLNLRYNMPPSYRTISFKTQKSMMGKGCAWYSAEEFEKAAAAPAILRLTEAVEGRPWEAGNTSPFKDLWLDYAAKAGWENPPEREVSLSRGERFQKKVFGSLGAGAYAFVNGAGSRSGLHAAARQYRRDEVGAYNGDRRQSAGDLLETQPLVSVIVPVYKVEEYLQKCVESIICQTYTKLEIILVDDGSPDSCPQICDEFALKDDRIKVLHKKNGGLSDARNAGLRIAHGEYVLFVDSDDYIEPDSCEVLLDAAEKGTDLITGTYIRVEGDKVRDCRRKHLRNAELFTPDEYIVRCIKNNDFYCEAFIMMYRRDFLLENELFYWTGHVFEDFEILPRMLLSAKKIVNAGYSFYNYIFRTGSITGSPMTAKKLADAVDSYEHWIDTVDPLENRKTKKYLYHEMCLSYIITCVGREMIGWWIDRMRFWFSLYYIRGWMGKWYVIRFELQTIYFMFVTGRRKTGGTD